MKKSKLQFLLLTLVFTVVSILLSATSHAQPLMQTAVKVHELDLFDKQRDRPVKVTLWYPAAEACDKAKICLSKNVRVDKTIVFSHGAMGAAKGYNWIGYALAAQGFVVAGVNHYGESWVYGQQNVDPTAALKVWHRPLDISFLLDDLNAKQAEGLFSRELNWKNVTAIGHSSGAATVLSLAGAQWDLLKAEQYCQSPSSKMDRSCGYMQHKSTHLKPEPALPSNFTDGRIKAVIALDPALGHVTDGESLRDTHIPVLLVASKQNDFLDFAQHAGFYLQHLPRATAVILDQGEGHFVYLDKCEHEYKAMGVAICEDRPGVNRQGVHRRLYPHLFSFLNKG